MKMSLVLNEKYATGIASQWNVGYNEDYRGYVTIFEIDDEYGKKFEVHTVGDCYHQEQEETIENRKKE